MAKTLDSDESVVDFVIGGAHGVVVILAILLNFCVYFVCFCSIPHSCCIIVNALGVDLVGLKPNPQDLSFFSALTLFVGSFDP